jgi:hypothetical protein
MPTPFAYTSHIHTQITHPRPQTNMCCVGFTLQDTAGCPITLVLPPANAVYTHLAAMHSEVAPLGWSLGPLRHSLLPRQLYGVHGVGLKAVNISIPLQAKPGLSRRPGPPCGPTSPPREPCEPPCEGVAQVEGDALRRRLRRLRGRDVGLVLHWWGLEAAKQTAAAAGAAGGGAAAAAAGADLHGVKHVWARVSKACVCFFALQWSLLTMMCTHCCSAASSSP